MFNFKKLKSNFNIGSNVFNNSFKATTPLSNSNIVHKKVLYYDKRDNAPPVTFVKQVYSKLPDDETVPVEFMTKRKYLQQYIQNQEKQDSIRFTKQEKQKYIKTELQDMRPIVSRFTTYHNPYMPPKVVFFTDSKINKQQFKHNAQHEFGHELYERQPQARQQWNFTVNKNTSPTNYGRTSVDEDFAESYALYKDKRLQDSRRQEVFNNIKVDEHSKNHLLTFEGADIGRRTNVFKYRTPEGIPVTFQETGNTTLENYPSIDDVGYMLDTLPQGTLPPNTVVRFTPRKYIQKHKYGTINRTAKLYTYANAGKDIDDNDNERNVIRVFPQKSIVNKDFRKFREGFIHEVGHVQDNTHRLSSNFFNTGLRHKTAITDYGRKNTKEDVAESFVHYNKVGGHFERKYYNNPEDINSRMEMLNEIIPHTQLQSNPNVREAVEDRLRFQTTKIEPNVYGDNTTITRTNEELESDAREKQHKYSPEELPFVDDESKNTITNNMRKRAEQERRAIEKEHVFQPTIWTQDKSKELIPINEHAVNNQIVPEKELLLKYGNDADRLIVQMKNEGIISLQNLSPKIITKNKQVKLL